MKKLLVLTALLAAGCSGIQTWGNCPAPRTSQAPLVAAQAVPAAAARI